MRPNAIMQGYGVALEDGQAIRARVSELRTGDQQRLGNIVKELLKLAPGQFPEPNHQPRFDSLVIRLGQALRELFPDLADDDEAWARLAVAFAYTGNGGKPR